MVKKTKPSTTANPAIPPAQNKGDGLVEADEIERRSYLDKDIKLLWGLAAARCSHPSCRIECVAPETTQDRAAIFGEIAHIVAHGKKGPRADASYPRDLLNKYENLILLCRNHHKPVDDQQSTYTIIGLRQWKMQHEGWVRTSLANEVPNIGFPELEIISKAILTKPQRPVENMVVPPIADKIERNKIGVGNQFLITMALSKVAEVGEFVNHVALMDDRFPERLKSGFVEEYTKHRINGIEPDELFTLLVNFASGNSNDFKRRAAGLATLVYLFEKCEVFEP